MWGYMWRVRVSGSCRVAHRRVGVCIVCRGWRVAGRVVSGVCLAGFHGVVVEFVCGRCLAELLVVVFVVSVWVRCLFFKGVVGLQGYCGCGYCADAIGACCLVGC